MSSAADQANDQMVDWLIADGSLWSPDLIAAFRATPRHRFLDRVFVAQAKTGRWREILTRDPGPDETRLLYSDRALVTHVSPGRRGQPGVPISSSSQPSLMAQMLEDLHPAAGQRILEVGAGTGYNAALLAHVVGPGRVTSVDVDRNVLSEAWDHLRAFPERQVNFKHADGRDGWPAAAPYDRIMVTAATHDLEPAWLDQLSSAGILSAPLVLAPGLAYIVQGSVTDGVFDGRLIRAAYFMSLRAEGESGLGQPGLAPVDELESHPAPWAEWFGRRRRNGWLRFSRALAFYGWLRGRAVHFQTPPDSAGVYGVSDAGHVCWFGLREWQVSGRRGTDVGRELWRAFLNAGGPWPTEFRLRARPGGDLLATGARDEYVRQGPLCRQVWQLVERRERPA